MHRPEYPATRTVTQLDYYHGTIVSDPYRWLEDDANDEIRDWIAAQNSATAAYLAALPVRQQLRQRFDQLLSYSRYYDLVRRGSYLFFKKNDGLQNQLIAYVQQGLTGSPEVLINPNDAARDGTVRLGRVVPSRDARYVAYGLSVGGAEWEDFFVTDVITKERLPDRLQWVKTATIAWRDHGFYYSRYPTPPSTTGALSARHERQQVWYHRVGTPQADDVLVYEDPTHPLRLYFVQTTDDERFILLNTADLGAGHASHTVHLLDGPPDRSEAVPLFTSCDDAFSLVGADDDGLLFITTRHAPLKRLIRIDPAHADEAHWHDVIPEGHAPLESVTVCGGKLFTTYRQDGAHRLFVLDQTGALENEIRLPGIGLTQVFQGQRDDPDVFWTFTSFTVPPTTYRYDIAQRASSPLWEPDVRYRIEDYETSLVHYASKDGTSIPMFIVHQRDLPRNGRHPLLLSGYGGYGVSLGPAFDPFVIALLERGVVYAVACLRGGGEYGEAWHRAGWREHKQTVFDDCIAGAEFLQAQGYTSKDRSALIGSSNGGLLVGAVMTQRPDLFRVALPVAGVMDMLRFQKCTLGWTWTAEYGSSDDPAMIDTLLAYSPVHNIGDGVSYPSTLVATYANDDCVVPWHSFKFIATLQNRGAESHPYLIRVETMSGHGAVSLPKVLDEKADLYAFLLANMPS